MDIWHITIWDGNKEIDHHFIDISISVKDITAHCLNIFFGENSPYDIFRQIDKDEEIVIDKESGKESYNIYCTNLIPDITIERKKIIETIDANNLCFTNIR